MTIKIELREDGEYRIVNGKDVKSGAIRHGTYERLSEKLTSMQDEFLRDIALEDISSRIRT